VTGRRRALLRAVLGAAVVVIGLAIGRPWTIRPLHQATPALFDPASYVASIWPRVLETAEASAKDVAEVLAGPGGDAPAASSARKAAFVRGTGVVMEVDRGSRVGLARIRIDGVPAPGAAIQVGPVLRGTAVRDALDFVRFTDFSNQSDFAAVASALNDRVLQSVLAPVDIDSLAGASVSFVGAVSLAARRTEGPLEIVPLVLDAGAGAR